MPSPADSDKAPLVVILAGGRSSRFGRDKARVEVLGRESLERVRAAALQAVGSEADVIVHDQPAGGPLGAVLEVMGAWPGRDLVVLACDLPFIDAATIERVVGALRSAPDVDAMLPRIDGRAQPLAAAYRARAVTGLRAAWDGGERAIVKGLSHLRVGWIDDLAAGPLDDFDTPEELACLEARRAQGA